MQRNAMNRQAPTALSERHIRKPGIAPIRDAGLCFKGETQCKEQQARSYRQKVWWLKINKKPVRKGSLDRAAFPYVVKIRYVVNGKEYIRKKWIGTKYPVPAEGDTVQLAYEENRPEKIKVVY